MKALKRISALVLMMVMMLSFSTTAFATEVEDDGMSPVSLSIISESMTFDMDSLVVEFYDTEDGAMLKAVTLSNDNNWQVDFELPSEAVCSVVIAGVEDTPFVVVDIFGDRTTSVTKQNYLVTKVGNISCWAVTGEKDASENDATTTVESTVGQTDAPASYEGLTGKKAYEAFLEEISFIESDSSWQWFLSLYGKDSPLYAGWAGKFSEYYAEYVQGGTEEKYFELSNFEQFLWTETYLKLAYASFDSGDFHKYYGTRVGFDNYIVGLTTNTMKNYNGSDTVIAAFEKLMDWQYNYIVTDGNSVPYCFITDRSSMKETEKTPVVNEPEDDIDSVDELIGELSKEEQQELEDSLKEPESNEKVEEEEKGIWDDTVEALAQNALSLVIFAVLCIVLAVVVIRRKKRNIDER